MRPIRFHLKIWNTSADFFDVKTKKPFDKSIKTYEVVVKTPYTLTIEEVKAASLAEFEKEKANYGNSYWFNKMTW